MYLITQNNNGCDSILQRELMMYPNPFKDYAMIDFGTNFKGNYSIRAYTVFGQLVIDEKAIEDSIYKLERGNLVKGEYSLQGMNEESTIIFNSKLIIQ